MHISVATPTGFEPDAASVATAKAAAAEAGTTVVLTTSAAEAVKDADIVYTDTWVSMGQETEKAARIKQFEGFQVNEALMAQAAPEALFLHCLPAYRGLEVSEGVIDGPQSVVFDEAENRLHAQKAVLVKLMG
jgi:ornithine carbamoyltransferase